MNTPIKNSKLKNSPFEGGATKAPQTRVKNHVLSWIHYQPANGQESDKYPFAK
jgi:hypothetical protein